MAAPQQISRALAVATFACAVAQLAMVVAGHYNDAIAQQFAIMGVTISFGAGVMYASSAPDPQRGRAALNGAIAGGVGALIGVIVSYALGDVTASILAIGTISSAVSGALGGFAGSFLAARRAAA